MTPEETDVVVKHVHELLDTEANERVEHTKAAMSAAAARPTLF